MLRSFLVPLSVVLLVCCLCGCDEMQEAMTQELAKKKEVPDINRSAEKETQQASRIRVVAETKPKSEHPLGQPAGTSAADMPRIDDEPAPEQFAPLFNGVPRYVVYPHREGRQSGVRFELWVGLHGSEHELSAFAFEVEIRDQSGGSMTFPIARNDRTLVLREVVLGAGIKEQYEYQVYYYVPGEEIDAETGKEPRYVLLKDWGKFRMGT